VSFEEGLFFSEELFKLLRNDKLNGVFKLEYKIGLQIIRILIRFLTKIILELHRGNTLIELIPFLEHLFRLSTISI